MQSFYLYDQVDHYIERDLWTVRHLTWQRVWWKLIFLLRTIRTTYVMSHYQQNILYKKKL